MTRTMRAARLKTNGYTIEAKQTILIIPMKEEDMLVEIMSSVSGLPIYMKHPQYREKA